MIEKGIDWFEHILIVLVSRLAPWAAPLAPAFLVARSIQVHFKAPLVVGIAVGITLEAVGVATMHITMDMWSYNTDPARVQTDPKAPFVLGVLASITYFLSGFVLTVLLEIVPGSIKVAPALFFLLSGVAYLTLALIEGQSKRKQQVVLAKAGRKRTGGQSTDGDRTDPVKWPDKDSFLSDPDRPDGLTVPDIVRSSGVSNRTARRWLSATRNGGHS